MQCPARRTMSKGGHELSSRAHAVGACVAIDREIAHFPSCYRPFFFGFPGGSRGVQLVEHNPRSIQYRAQARRAKCVGWSLVLHWLSQFFWYCSSSCLVSCYRIACLRYLLLLIVSWLVFVFACACLLCMLQEASWIRLRGGEQCPFCTLKSNLFVLRNAAVFKGGNHSYGKSCIKQTLVSATKNRVASPVPWYQGHTCFFGVAPNSRAKFHPPHMLVTALTSTTSDDVSYYWC